jgi:hypothetical protein
VTEPRIGIVDHGTQVGDDLALAESLERDALAVAVRQDVGQVCVRARRRAARRVAQRGHDQDTSVRELVDQLAQELERGAVRAVQVVEHEQPRRVLRSAHEGLCNRLERAMPRRPLEAEVIRAICRGLALEALEQVAQHGIGRLSLGRRRRDLAQQAQPRPERRRVTGLAAEAPRHAHRLTRERELKRFDDARLADARLPHECTQPAPT